ncbi:low molecular weight protein tyrosine phosphatase family protein [Novipirellula sp. SH528]|uniref:low molecular weight protein tyrosine phosphatase family protein n=1 Tax=Novipirellula sp. SH528 TaxID=3454466 RepID=UPI003F9F600C
MMRTRPNILFVCSKNQWRSPTAEAIYRSDDRISVRSRGTAKAAVQTIRASDVAWADAILVMEDKHRQRILADFPDESKFKSVHVLDIPDDYRFMDDELLELIKSAAEPVIDQLTQ